MFLYQPKVSIVIPAYNASNYLADAIESALSQTYGNYEIIVVNDGSRDDGKTAEVAARYAGKIRYFEKENGGSSSALNCGIQQMTGEWFSWLSHDDLYYPDKLEKQIRLMNSLNLFAEELKGYVFFGGSDLIDADGKFIRKTDAKTNEKIGRFVNGVLGNEYLVAEPTRFNFHGCSCLVHRSAFEKVGCFDERLRLLNDIDMWYRLYTQGFIVRYVPESLVMGRVHSKQISRAIGYSYHNPEQDMFWERTRNWLLKNHSDKPELLFAYAKNAYMKTRNIDGDIICREIIKLDLHYGKKLKRVKCCYQLYAKMRNAAKQLYLKVKA